MAFTCSGGRDDRGSPSLFNGKSPLASSTANHQWRPHCPISLSLSLPPAGHGPRRFRMRRPLSHIKRARRRGNEAVLMCGRKMEVREGWTLSIMIQFSLKEILSKENIRIVCTSLVSVDLGTRSNQVSCQENVSRKKSAQKRPANRQAAALGE